MNKPYKLAVKAIILEQKPTDTTVASKIARPAMSVGQWKTAIELDPSAPESLCAYLEFQIAHQRTTDIISLMGTMIESAVQRCRKQIEAGMNLQRAYLWLGKLQLLQGHEYAALSGFAKAIQRCTTTRILKEAIESMKRLEAIGGQLPGYESVRRLLLLGLAMRSKHARTLAAIRHLASPPAAGGKVRYRVGESVVILAGGCDASVQTRMEGYREMLLRAFDGFEGVIICGGTREGISGLAGDIARAYRKSVRAIGYIPTNVPANATLDKDKSRYCELIQSDGSGFSPLEPLQYWIDLIAAGIEPSKVKMLGLNGGQLSTAEYMIAAVLGARVALVERSGRAAEQLFDDPDWADTGFLRVPADAMTLRAFLLTDTLECDRRKLEKAARKVHQEYMASVTPKDDSLKPWENLNEDLKTSCFHQVAYAINILKTVGLGIRPLTNARRPLLDMEKEFSAKKVRELAEMEHGRWNTERLLLGWTRGAKDIAQKRNPSLVPWNELPLYIQQYDVNAIRKLPLVLHEAGLEVYKL